MTDDIAKAKIDGLFETRLKIIKMLEKNNSIMVQGEVDEVLTKTLILYVASYFERRMIDTLVGAFENACPALPLIKFVTDTSLNSRDFSKLFSWTVKPGSKRIGKHFFRKFGKDFADYMNFKMDEDLRESIRAFIVLGSMRNKMIHGNLAEFDLASQEMTIHDVQELYGRAMHFVDTFCGDLSEYSAVMDRAKRVAVERHCDTPDELSDIIHDISGVSCDVNYCRSLLQQWKRGDDTPG